MSKSFKIVDSYLKSCGIYPLNVIETKNLIDVIVLKEDLSATKLALKHAIGSINIVTSHETVSFSFDKKSVRYSKFMSTKLQYRCVI